MSRHYLRASILTASLGLAAALPTTAAAAAAQVPASLAATPVSTRPMVGMSLNEAIQIALEKNFNILGQNLNLLNSKDDFLSAKLAFRPTYSITSNLRGAQNGATGNATSTTPHTDGQSVAAAISQALTTGGSVSLSSTILSRANTANSPIFPNFSRSLTLSVSQQLLRGAGTTYNLHNLRKSKITYDLLPLSYKTSLSAIVQQIEVSYINLTQARQTLEIAQRSLRLAEITYTNAKTRNEVGLTRQVDMYGSETDYLTSQNSVLVAENSLTKAEDDFRTVLGGGDYNIGIIPTDDLVEDPIPLPSVESALQKVLENNIDYITAKNAVKFAETDVFKAKSDLKPGLQLVAQVSSSDTTATWGSSYHKVSEKSNYGWSVNLTLDVPLGERAATIAYRKKLNDLQQRKIDLAAKELDLRNRVRSTLNGIANSSRSVDLQIRTTELARLNYESQKSLFDAGTSTIIDLTSRLNAYENAQISLLNAKISLRTQTNALRTLLNTTLDRFNIKLPE